MTCWCHPQFGVFVRAFPTQVLTISTWCSTHKLFGNFDQSIAVPTNMLNRFQSSCDRQHRQQPLLHNSKRLFSRHKCVLSWAGGKKWGWNADAVRICRYEHKEISACWLHTHVLPVPCPPSEQFMLLLQGHCKPFISRRWKVMTGKKEAYRIILIHSDGNSTHHK